MRGRMLVSDMEAQPVLRVERKKETPRSDHTKLLTLFSLLNVFVGLYFLFFKNGFNLLVLPGKEITIMDVVDSSDHLCGVLLIAIGFLCWTQRNHIIEPVQQGVFIALANVAVGFAILVVFIHSASIATHQTYKNAFICRGVYQTNATIIFEVEGSKYSKDVYCGYLNQLYLFDSVMIACGLAAVVLEGMAAMHLYYSIALFSNPSRS